MATNPDERTQRLVVLCEMYLRRPIAFASEAGVPVLVFEPVLTAPEQATYNRLLAIAGSANLAITPTEWASIEDDLAQIRAFRQQSQSEFIAKGQNARDREIFDTLNSLINVQRVMIRD